MPEAYRCVPRCLLDPLLLFFVLVQFFFFIIQNEQAHTHTLSLRFAFFILPLLLS
jgi:hypothetical protein